MPKNNKEIITFINDKIKIINEYFVSSELPKDLVPQIDDFLNSTPNITLINIENLINELENDLLIIENNLELVNTKDSEEKQFKNFELLKIKKEEIRKQINAAEIQKNQIIKEKNDLIEKNKKALADEISLLLIKSNKTREELKSARAAFERNLALEKLRIQHEKQEQEKLDRLKKIEAENVLKQDVSQLKEINISNIVGSSAQASTQTSQTSQTTQNTLNASNNVANVETSKEFFFTKNNQKISNTIFSKVENNNSTGSKNEPKLHFPSPFKSANNWWQINKEKILELPNHLSKILKPSAVYKSLITDKKALAAASLLDPRKIVSIPLKHLGVVLSPTLKINFVKKTTKKVINNPVFTNWLKLYSYFFQRPLTSLMLAPPSKNSSVNSLINPAILEENDLTQNIEGKQSKFFSFFENIFNYLIKGIKLFFRLFFVVFANFLKIFTR